MLFKIVLQSVVARSYCPGQQLKTLRHMRIYGVTQGHGVNQGTEATKAPSAPSGCGPLAHESSPRRLRVNFTGHNSPCRASVLCCYEMSNKFFSEGSVPFSTLSPSVSGNGAFTPSSRDEHMIHPGQCKHHMPLATVIGS